MSPATDPFDHLTSVYLTDSGDEEPGVAAIELMIVGHLPVHASLWLTPYADAVARREGATGLVRLDRGEPMIEVLRLGESGTVAEDIGTCRNLRETILRLGPAVRHWIVRPSSQASIDDLLETGLGRPGDGAGPSRVRDLVTILSSADQVALASAYRVIKHMAERAGAGAGAVPEVGLVVIGCDRAAAEQMAGTLDATARAQLGIPVPLVASVARMDSGVRETLLRTFPGHPRPHLAELTAWIAEARSRSAPAAPPPEPPAPPPVTTAAAVTAEPPRAVDTTDLDAGYQRGAGEEPVQSPVLTGLPDASYWRQVVEGGDEAAAATAAAPEAPPAPAPPPPPAPAAAPAPAPAPRVTIAPKARVEIEPRAPMQSAEPDEAGRPVPLARHVPDPDAKGDETHLRPIAPRCPDHERVELAVDGRGRLHLLGREDTLRAMAVVESWARAHRELIGMACPGTDIDPRGQVVCHVFTEEPLRVADLHGSSIHLHLLTPVEVDGRRGWYAAALNRPRR